MPSGFSQSTALPASTAVSTSERWHELGVVTRTASTSGDLQSSATELKARGMLYSLADSFACLMSRRESAVTRQFFDQEKPGIKRLTACIRTPRCRIGPCLSEP